MHKLCHPVLIVSVIFAFIISACGRDTYYPQPKMTEQEAFSEISNSLNSGRGALGKSVSADGLQKVLEQAIRDGKIKVPGQTRGAVDLSQVDLSGLSQILGLITSGKTNNAFSLASQILTMLPALTQTATSGASKLDIIMSILQQALPIIATIAPQFAPIVSALVVIMPLVMSFINMFKKKPKPSPSPTASLFTLGYAKA